MQAQEEIMDGALYNTSDSVFCFATIPTTSAGYWAGGNPLHCSFPVLMVQMTIIFVFYRLTHAILRRLGQPLVISQIVAGIILGPSILSREKRFRQLMYYKKSFEQWSTVGVMSNMLFYFIVGVKADLGLIPKVGRKAAAIALICTLLPVVSVCLTAHFLRHQLQPKFTETYLLLGLTNRWCLTSFVVLSATLSELNLLSSELGRLAMSATLIADFVHLFTNACIVTYLLSVRLSSPQKGVAAFLSFFGLVGVIVFVLRPVALWLIRRTPDGDLLDQASFVAVLLMALASGLLSQLMGFDIRTGTFFFGLVLPGGAPLGTTVVERMEKFVMGLMMPLSVVEAGMRMKLALLADPGDWGIFEMFLMMCVVSKFLGVILPCLYCRMPHRDALSLGLIMTTKGISEARSAIQWQDGKTIGDGDYNMIIITILVFGGGTAPLIKYLYRPEDHFVTYKRRTLQHAKSGEELRVLVSIHHQDNVKSILTLLHSSGIAPTSPTCIYYLHLIQLVGRADAVLHPHKHHRKSSSSSSLLSETDLIVNAFRSFEKQHADAVTAFPFISISPYHTMHDDVCSLAFEKKVSLVILPFHRNIGPGGTISSASPGIQSVNINVLRYAPCSVGILVDKGRFISGHQLDRAAVYFFGGADDREALSYGMRMVENTAIGLTVVRFLLPAEWRQDGPEEKMDEAVLRQFRDEKVDGERVVYQEEVVRDGEGTVRVIGKTSHEFSLLIVGRSEGKESPLTRGMSMWSEYPELGVVGDLLASTDFGGQVSTLVVQQQVRSLKEGAERVAPESPKTAPLTVNRVVPRNMDWL